jgi:hypothetical protein
MVAKSEKGVLLRVYTSTGLRESTPFEGPWKGQKTVPKPALGYGTLGDHLGYHLEVFDLLELGGRLCNKPMRNHPN